MKAVIVVDLGFGDSGKGTIVDYLSRQEQSLVVRYNGGAQAAHNVVTDDGRHHTFSQFGSGLFVPGTRSHLSRFMLINPISMMTEEESLKMVGIKDAFERTTIEDTALVITPFQQAANRLKEIARGNKLHGSCGAGVGETMCDSLELGDVALRIGDLADSVKTLSKLQALQAYKRTQVTDFLANFSGDLPQYELEILFKSDIPNRILKVYKQFVKKARIVRWDYLPLMMQAVPQTIFEGAQGVLLDENYGFHPYTTWTTTTDKNARTLLNSFDGEIKTLGVLRSYHTRHGAGPFVTEDNDLPIPRKEKHNTNNDWQHQFRVGHFDFVMARYAIKACGGVDELAITHVDNIPVNTKVCESYECKGRTLRQIIPSANPTLKNQEMLTDMLFNCKPNLRTLSVSFLSLVEQTLGVPITLTSWGDKASDKSLIAANIWLTNNLACDRVRV